MSDKSQTADAPLAIGQVWIPKRGKPRQIVAGFHDLPGVHFVTLPEQRTGHCLGSVEFRKWIAHYCATLRETIAND
jgi:hypothetical protein